MESGVCASRSVPIQTRVNRSRYFIITYKCNDSSISEKTFLTALGSLFLSVKKFLLNLPRFIARRIAFNSEHSFSRFIIRLAISATAISVMAMILTIAFAQGFKYAIADKMYAFSGHIRVQHFESDKTDSAESGPVTQNDTVISILKSDPAVESVHAFANKDAILKGPESFEGLNVKGVEPAYSFAHIQEFLKSGRWIHFPDSGYSTEINLSTYTANQLKLKVNDKILIYFIQPDGTPKARPLTVAGMFKTGIEDYDKLIAIGDLRLIQRLNNWDHNEIGGYEVFLKDYRKLDTVNSMIFQQLPSSWNSRTIK